MVKDLHLCSILSDHGATPPVHCCVCTLKQSIQLVHVPLSSWHNAVFGTQLDKVCYYSITHSSAHSSQGSHVSPALDRLLALPLQVWLTVLD